MEVQRMELGKPDASGRRRPVPIPGSERLLPVETVIIAVGNQPNPLIAKTTPAICTTRCGGIVVDPVTQRTSLKGVFAGGDVVLGAATVILAMGEGRRAAQAIHQYLENGEWTGAPEPAEPVLAGQPVQGA